MNVVYQKTDLECQRNSGSAQRLRRQVQGFVNLRQMIRDIGAVEHLFLTLWCCPAAYYDAPIERTLKMKAFAIEHSKIAYFADSAVYLAAILLLSIFLIRFAPPQAGTETAISVVAGLLGWSLIEYAMHRLVFHGIQPFQRLHAEHHRRPQALIATPTVLSVILIVVFVWLPATLLVGVWSGCGVTLGVTTGYFAYGVIHHAVHHWRSRSARMRQRKRLHAIHHRFPHCNYGVTISLWDYLFRSRKLQ